MKIKTLFIFSLLVLSNEVFSADISISTTINKSEYIVGEGVLLEMEAINQLNQGLAFNPFVYNQIVVKDSKNKTYTKNLADQVFYYENFEPGDTFRTWVDLTSEYGKPYENSSFFYFPVGEYSVYIDYEEPVKKIKLTTEKLHFKIKKPDPFHQKILDRLIKADLRQTSRIEAIDIYDQLIRDYPKNPYSSTIYAKRLIKEKFTEKAKTPQFRQLCLKAIYELADNPYVTSYIGTLISHYRKIKDKDNLEKTLRKIIKDNPGERTTAFAIRMYRRINKATFEEFMNNEY